MGFNLVQTGIFTVFAFNGKDLFLQAVDGSFVVKSYQELKEEIRLKAEKGRRVEILCDGSIVLIKTPAELEVEREKNHRHVKLLGEIAAFEAGGTKDFPEHYASKLASLRERLKEFEPDDPTAVTLEQKRANASLNEQ